MDEEPIWSNIESVRPLRSIDLQRLIAHMCGEPPPMTEPERPWSPTAADVRLLAELGIAAGEERS